MVIKHRKASDESENNVTSEWAYLNRRKFMLAAGAGLIGAGATVAATQGNASSRELMPLTYSENPKYRPDEAATPEAAVTRYNNYYEFGIGKEDPFINAWRLEPKPWSVLVDGLCEKPGTYAFEDLVDLKALEERIYRLRCVEAWSMVVPWIGVPLSSVIKKLAPTSDAKYIRFETLADKDQMPGIRWPVVEWPYTEGLRMDEAMNDLAFIAVGLYGKEIPNQNGAPLRLVTPWKYGFKSVKSIARISFTDKQPYTAWMGAAPKEYGFFSNVNPNRAHPRWSQARERRIGEFGRRDTLMFNGYGEEVADLYAGMDLNVFF